MRRQGFSKYGIKAVSSVTIVLWVMKKSEIQGTMKFPVRLGSLSKAVSKMITLSSAYCYTLLIVLHRWSDCFSFPLFDKNTHGIRRAVFRTERKEERKTKNRCHCVMEECHLNYRPSATIQNVFASINNFSSDTR